MGWREWVRVSAVCLFATAGVEAQETGSAEGVVTDAVTGAAVRKALVTAHRTGGGGAYQVLAGPAGRFRFDSLAAGSYTFCAEAQGYSPRSAAFAERGMIRTTTVAAGKTANDITLRISPLSVIFGRVFDENGTPIAGATVETLHYEFTRNGRQERVTDSVATNDLGEYRFFDVEPGVRQVRVRKSLPSPTATGRVHGTTGEYAYPPTLHDELIDLAPGAEAANIDFRLRRQRVYRVRGTVVDARTNQPVPQADIQVLGHGGVMSGRDGTFVVRGKVPGAYRMVASISGQPRLVSEMQEVVVGNQDRDGVVLRLVPCTGLRGTVRFDGNAPEKMPNVGIRLESIEQPFENPAARTGAGGNFVVPNAAPRIYRVIADLDGVPYYAKSIRMGDQDASGDGRIDLRAAAAPLALTLAPAAGSLEGVAALNPDRNAPVIVYLAPAGRRADWERMSTVNPETGAFRFENLAPGTYKLFAWEMTDAQLSETTGFTKLYESRAATVEIRDDERQIAHPAVLSASEVFQGIRKLR